MLYALVCTTVVLAAAVAGVPKTYPRDVRQRAEVSLGKSCHPWCHPDRLLLGHLGHLTEVREQLYMSVCLCVCVCGHLAEPNTWAGPDVF